MILAISSSAQPQSFPGDTDTDEILLELLIFKGALLEVTSRLPSNLTVTPEDAERGIKELGELLLTVFSLTDYRVNIQVDTAGLLPEETFRAWVHEVRGPLSHIYAPEPLPFPIGGEALPLFAGGNNAGTPTTVTVRVRLDLRALPEQLPRRIPVSFHVYLEELSGGG